MDTSRTVIWLERAEAVGRFINPTASTSSILSVWDDVPEPCRAWAT